MSAWRNGGGKPFAIHYEIFKMDPKWKDEEELKNFLFDRYQKKDKLLESYYKTGSFSSESKEAQFPSDMILIGFHILIMGLFALLVIFLLSFVY
ncbi:Acyltransferase C-terminal domain-containing protein [Caenorhabditis elegans]|nr:Acyltransferase C-terminal domain-containing protein [Caenorhabditis elegans]CDR32725.1 Acyltransferase C-terminal domain-containing protein [Caenorhabditis elegans]|eukprot:NP_001293956.1 ACyLtransferase-like [Caenorhabditis elegans]